ncbi:MAG: DUF4031 domain-containing protein [Acidimicrobiia bacterium]
MTILIDEARWHHCGRKWCHLVSHESYDELHACADANGIPRRGFQGDHYDIPEEYRADLIAAGAEVVESRVLLRRLKAAGLRLTPGERRRFQQSVTNAAVRSPAPEAG